MKKILTIIPRALICGVCSGIPACCVREFLLNSITGTKPAAFHYKKVMESLFRALYVNDIPSKNWEFGGISYSPCLKCLSQGRVVKILDCWGDYMGIDPAIHCFLRDGGKLKKWDDDPSYFFYLKDFLRPYFGGKVQKDFIVVRYGVNS